MTKNSDQSFDYARDRYHSQRHHERRARYIASLPRKLWCQDCGGMGGEKIPILDDGSGPFEFCGWCEGSGLMTPHERGFWLRCQREWKRQARSIQ